MRDVLISRILEQARRDPNVVFVSADFGAPSLDVFRRELPKQFINVGIAEQVMIDMAAGLALSGKQVFCYAMAPFITSRCFEQIKCSLGAMNLPVTLIGVGVGLGYDVSSMTHIAVEDVACMRTVNNLEVLSPCDRVTTNAIASLVLESPALRYIRLDRQVGEDLRTPQRANSDVISGVSVHAYGRDVMFVSSGSLTHCAMRAAELISTRHRESSVGALEIIRNKPISESVLSYLSGASSVVFVEEQRMEGNTGSAVLEAAVDKFGHIPWRVKRLGIPDGFSIGTGNRESYRRGFGLDVDSIVEEGMKLWKAST